jgi:hypothetical protein
MADIKTMTREVTDLQINIEESMMGGDYEKIVAILNKIIEKLDELVEKANS